MNEADRQSENPTPKRGSKAVLIAVAALVATLVTVRGHRTEVPLPVAQAERGHDAVELLQRAASHLAVERGLVYAALHAKEPIAPAWRAEIERRRESSEAAMRVAIEASAGLIDVNLAYGAIPTRGARGTLASLRERVDAVLATGTHPENGYLPEVWFRETSRLIEQTQMLGAVVHLRLIKADAATTQWLRLQHLAADIAEVAGRQRATVGALLIADQPTTARALLQLASVRDRLAERRLRLRRLSERASDPAITREVERLERTLDGEFAAYRETLLDRRQAVPHGTQAAATWFDLATRTIDGVIEVGERAAQTARRQGAPRPSTSAL